MSAAALTQESRAKPALTRQLTALIPYSGGNEGYPRKKKQNPQGASMFDDALAVAEAPVTGSRSATRLHVCRYAIIMRASPHNGMLDLTSPDWR